MIKYGSVVAHLSLCLSQHTYGLDEEDDHMKRRSLEVVEQKVATEDYYGERGAGKASTAGTPNPMMSIGLPVRICSNR